jgi:hypothetical protein
MDSQNERGADRRRWSGEKSTVLLILSAGQSWSCYRLAVGLLLLATFGCSPRETSQSFEGSGHLFVWAWDVDKSADDFLAVVDLDRGSATYGQVVRTLPAPGGTARTTSNTK